MMDLQDFENFLEFTKNQIAILKEKENGKYKNNSWKDYIDDDLLDDLLNQVDKYEFVETNIDKQRRLLHIANYAFFLYEKLRTA